MKSRIELYSSIVVTVNQYVLLSSITLSRSAFVRAVNHQSFVESKAVPQVRLSSLGTSILKGNMVYRHCGFCRRLRCNLTARPDSCSLELSSRPLSSCPSTRTYCSRCARRGPGLFRENSFRRKENCFQTLVTFMQQKKTVDSRCHQSKSFTYCQKSRMLKVILSLSIQGIVKPWRQRECMYCTLIALLLVLLQACV